MGKYMRKGKGSGEVAVMEVSSPSLGVRTRARTLALQKSATATARLQKPTSYLQLRSRRLEKPPFPDKTHSPQTPKTTSTGSNPNPNHGSKQSHSGNAANPRIGQSGSAAGSVSLSKSCSKTRDGEEVVSVDCAKPVASQTLENEPGVEASFGENVVDFDVRERGIRETTPSSLIRDPESLETPGSTTRPTNAASNRRLRSESRRHAPTACEMEEFFARAELQQQKRFTEKYGTTNSLFWLFIIVHSFLGFSTLFSLILTFLGFFWSLTASSDPLLCLLVCMNISFFPFWVL
ncbi:cyclin-dependent kinase inhibitor 5 [Amborella trichopoda]|uniref:cyclin-dependent kinase inhibitor 5 n=1 Tax=Amborella trichopoda TaxID=13333 RepID=UPI0009C111EE|nr:cyclin-dependent kinase inhibitor 5 [Amborella trichopoda]|eukprot:XP_020530959.1 cyclin-dependent kinase inhibitor 5 [Amborella trichopoda]